MEGRDEAADVVCRYPRGIANAVVAKEYPVLVEIEFVCGERMGGKILFEAKEVKIIVQLTIELDCRRALVIRTIQYGRSAFQAKPHL